MTSPDAILVWSTVGEESVAETLAETLVAEQLAACVHILPRGRSFYVWQGERHRDEEFTLLIKTRSSLYSALELRLRQLHPYEVPEILATPVAGGLPDYLAWLATNTRTAGSNLTE